MIKINCETKDTIKLVDIIPFQGNLKKRTDEDLNTLKESILNEGLMMPFAVWRNNDKKFLLDGHGRKEVFMRMANECPEILSIDFPCVYIDAESEDDARKALLQITSSYGKITKQGYKQFTVSIPDYVAPAIKKFTVSPKTITTKNKTISANPIKRILKVRIDKDKFEQVIGILKQFDFIEVL